MNPEFKMLYDEMREGNPTATDSAGSAIPVSDPVLFSTPGHIRNLELVWPEGKRAFRNYSYLSGGELKIDSEANSIGLYFSSDTVLIKGFALAGLFAAVLDQTVRQIFVTDERYVDLRENGEIMVTEITFGPVLS